MLRTLKRVAAWIGHLPVRVRLTLSFAAVMVVLFGAIALALYFTFAAGLDTSIDNSLTARASDLVRAGISSHTGLSSAQIIDAATGRVIDPRGRTPLLRRQQLGAALAGSPFVSSSNLRMLVRPLRTPDVAGDVLVVQEALSQRNGALNTLGDLLFFGGPIALFLACAAGYLLAERVLAPVERMRRRAEGISGRRSGARLPVPNTHGDELQRLGETLNAMIARLDSALDRERVLVALASHELRTPLSIIKLELELALAPERSRSELEEALRSVIEEVDRLTLLAQDMLTVARADQGGLPLERQRIDVDELLRSTADRVARVTGASPSDLVIESERGLVTWADRARVERALGNMADNAVRHGGAPVVLRSIGRSGEVELHVIDHGPGFPAGFLPHAFERFSRADPAHPSSGGTGLGLTIVRAIAEAHGGSAAAENTPEGGAHVWLRLPLRPLAGDRGERTLSARP
ncbi:MAG: sensor histidine kinase [Solirubrobacteraceae bacterium]